MRDKAILFDLDDTLVVDKAVSKEALAKTATFSGTRHGTATDVFLAHAKAEKRRLWEANPHRTYCESIGISFEEILYGNFDGDGPEEFHNLRTWALDNRVRFYDALLLAQNVEEDGAAEELAEFLVSTRRRLQRLMPDALETLARLHEEFRIGLLTNGASSIQREKIRDAALLPLFDAVVVSGEKGVGKPKPEVFFHLLDELGVSPENAVMVGNSLARDVAGARAAGLAAAVWLRVSGSEEPADVTPDATIDGLHELPAVLRRIWPAR